MRSNVVSGALSVMFSAALALAQNPAALVSVDADANRHPINSNIYGVAYADAHDMATLNAPLNRWGGNSTSRYNWQIDAHSAAADWYFETYSDGNGTPGGSADAYVATTRAAHNGAEPMFTIPMIDYLANLGPGRSTLAGFSVKKYGAQTATDPWNSDAGNGVSASTGHNISGNNPLDTGIANSTAIQQAWVQHFVATLGPATSATGVKYYILDNEPSLWNSTHRDVHPGPVTYEELYAKIVAYATAIRAADPMARIAGPEEWSWWAMYYSGFDQANGWSAANSDYNTHGHTYYYPWLLQKLQTYRQQNGVPLIDILTVHAYNATPDGNDDSASAQQVRNRETRILWDPTFQDPSWYGDIGINGRILNWIPTLKAMVNQYCPGLQIGITEYNWGDEANLNGATTQADVLGIYGREGVDLATRWTVAKDTSTTPTTYYVTYLASQIYRNYDGNRSTFGDTSVSAVVADPDNLSAFAAVRSSDAALTVMVINKQQSSTPVTVSLANFSGSGTAQAWQINSASQTSIARLADVAVTNNAVTTTVPSQSITLFVIPPGSAVSLPAITAQPVNQVVVAGGNASFMVTATGTPAPTLKWQVSTDSGSNWSDVPNASPYSGVTTGTLTITGATVGMNGYQYRSLASNSVQSNVASNAATLTVQVAPTKPWAVTGTGQFEAGKKAGLLWSNAVTGETAIWLMNGLTSTGAASYAPGPEWAIAGTGDYDGDGKTDLLWRNTTTGGAVVWFMNGTALAGSKWIYDSGTAWVPYKLADFNGDGKTDILWHNNVTGDYAFWLMNGTGELLGASGFAVAPGWEIVQVADFNGDGRADLMWRNSSSGGIVLWLLNGTAIVSSPWIYDSGLTWSPAHIADFNGDGKADILWENVDGSKAIWLMNPAGELAGASGFSVASGWQVALTADFNGDGKADILWRNSSTGGVVMWLMNGTATTSTPWIYDSGPSWAPIFAADFNGDGKADILWQNTDGSLAIWLMDGATCTAGAGIY